MVKNVKFCYAKIVKKNFCSKAHFFARKCYNRFENFLVNNRGDSNA